MSGLRVLLADDRLGYDEIGLHGGGRCMIEWTRALLARGVEVTTVIRQSSSQLRAAVEAEGLDFVYLERGPFDPRTLADLLRLIRARGIQLAHLHGLAMSQFGRIAARIAGIPAIVHVHADYRLSRKGYPPHARLADHLLARTTARAILVSDALRPFATRAMGFRPHQLLTLHNPVDRSRFRRPTPEQRAAARRALGLPSGARAAVTVGRLDRLKGTDLQIAAWPRVREHVPDAVLLVAGDGPERPALERAAERTTPAGSVRFLGHRADVETVLWAGDVFVLTSRFEGLPLALLEAMSTGLPAVVTRAGGMPEIVRDDDNGFLVPPEDPSATAETIARTLADPALAQRLRAGAERTAARADLARYGATLEALYRELLEPRTLAPT